ncbi:MAG: single-stranded DNA-binding protein [Planctomycetota bacterium]|jgi:single-strand DNA-binding protein
MAGFNKVLLMGNLTRDPQLSYTPNQTAVADFGVAVNRRWKGQDGSAREETCFVDCRAFGRMAENINKYLSKGRPVFLEGRLTLDSWTAQDGTKRSRHRVTVENFQFLPGGTGAGPGARGTGEPDAQAEGTSEPEKQVSPDDIPF